MRHDRVGWNDVVWSKTNNPKMAQTAYKALLRRLPTKDRLFKWGITNDCVCALCNESEENHNHLFFTCNYSKYIWCLIKLKLDQNQIVFSLEEEIDHLRSVWIGKEVGMKLACIAITAVIWSIWKERNRRVFERKFRSKMEVSRSLINEIQIISGRIKGKVLTKVTEEEERLLLRWNLPA